MAKNKIQIFFFRVAVQCRMNRAHCQIQTESGLYLRNRIRNRSYNITNKHKRNILIMNISNNNSVNRMGNSKILTFIP